MSGCGHCRTGRGPHSRACDESDGVFTELKPLFIPLKREYYEKFKSGEKDTEYRRFGPRWNGGTCFVGRPVVLSLGYGKANRMRGVIRRFYTKVMDSADWLACYGSPDRAACIQISVEGRVDELV